MKTLRLFGMAIMMVVVCFGFTACSGDDDNPESLLGTWKLTDKYWGNSYYTFYDNGTFKMEDVRVDEDGDEYKYDEETNRYVAKEGKLYFYDGNSSYVWMTSDFSVNGNTLKLTNMTPGHDEGGYGTPEDPGFVNHLTMKKTTRPHWLDY